MRVCLIDLELYCFKCIVENELHVWILEKVDLLA